MSFSSKLSRWDLKVSPYLYISPFFILFVIVGLFPIAYTAVISLQEWDLVRNTGTFVGLDQYIWILSQEQFWVALRNTFSIFILSSVPQLILALFIAAMLDRNIRAKTFWRMSVLLPFVMAPVAVALIFSNLFGDNHGLVNTFLTDIGLPAIGWHKDPFWSHIA
ncbi:MAG: sugar ABC transporter permease, partial [Microbacteriaceae bacterium]